MSPRADHDRPPETDVEFDVVVIGGGFGGMYMLHRLRGVGMSARAFEVADDVGGTWYWNRYPGARCDVESMQYSYSFSEDLEQDWSWSEKYASQPEILEYARHVADRFDLRRDIRFRTRVTTASFDERAHRWTVETDRGDRVTGRFLVSAVGCLSAANLPAFEGMDDCQVPILHTGQWPHRGFDFSGLHVGVIGTGSSAIQSIPVIARDAKSVVVFQRTPNYAVPARNTPMNRDYERRVKASYPDFRALARTRMPAFLFQYDKRSALEVPTAARERHYEDYWRRGGLGFLGAFSDLLLNQASNDSAAEFVRGKIRSVVKDPTVARLLSPSNVFGCKRLCVDTGYYETFNLPHVSLVDVSETPIRRFTETGLAVADRHYDFDAIVCATGFAAMTGSLDRIRITGRNGMTLKEKWKAGPRTYLGLTSAGFPNFFTVTGPGSPSVLANMMPAIEQHVDWITHCLLRMEEAGARTIEPVAANEDDWVGHVNDVASESLRSTCSSWYIGANIPGRPRVFMPYIGGFPAYLERCNAEAESGYAGFTIEGGVPVAPPRTFPWTTRWTAVTSM